MILAKEWGGDGSLTPLSSAACTWDAFEYNGLSWVNGSDPTLTEEEINGRADILTDLDGTQYVRVRRLVDDAGSSTPERARTELFFSDSDCQIADWVDAEEEGADADQAYRWYRFGFRIPSSFQTLWQLTATDPFAIINQLAPRLDTGDSAAGAPCFATLITRDIFGHERFLFRRHTQPDAQPTENVLTNLYSQRLVRDRWYDVLIRARWSYTTLGEMDVWVNRRPVISETGVPNCLNDAPSRGGGGIKPKIGIYAGPGSSTLLLPWEVHHRGYIIGDKDATFADMHPEDSSAVSLERVSGPVAGVSYGLA